MYEFKHDGENKKRMKHSDGLMPICSYCNKIRDDSGKDYGEGNWEIIEEYINVNADQEFTHGICPECVEIAFPHI